MPPFDFQPTLTDPIVGLRPLRPSDWNGLYEAASDPLIWAGHPDSGRWREAAFRSFFEAALASGSALTALDPASGAIIGSSRFDCSRAEPGEVEIGWTFLIRRHWGGHVNHAMKRLMIEHALGHFDRVIFLIGETNIRSQTAIQRIGARSTKRTLDTDLNGRTIRHMLFALDRPDFTNGPLFRSGHADRHAGPDSNNPLVRKTGK